MNFDDAHSKFGKGAGVVITSSKGKIFNFAYRLEFEATNNVVEYEAHSLGLETTKDMGIKMLSISDDSDLIILQVKNEFACKCKRLKKYRNAIWDTMEHFDALNLTSIHRDENSLADKLAVAASTLQPSEELLNDDGKLEINFRLFVPVNMEYCRFFKVMNKF